MDMVDRLVGLILAFMGVLEVTWLADETGRVPDNEDTVPDDKNTAFSLIVLDILSVCLTVMPVQSKLCAETALAKKA